MAPVILGETRCEMFRLCADMDQSMAIYPIIKVLLFQLFRSTCACFDSCRCGSCESFALHRMHPARSGLRVQMPRAMVVIG